MPEQAPTLRDMIVDAKDRGLTYEQLAKNAVDPRTGHQASGSFINNIVTGKANRMPETKNLRAIAAGLGVPYERVRQAAIRQWVPPEDGVADEVPPGSRAELIEEIKRLQGIADGVLARVEGSGDAGERRGGAA